jgi:pyruvate ferredoxin oxidoreductase alpha subunit
MSKQIMETSMAIAHAVKLCKPSVIPMYPITPQTHIVENISEFINNGDLKSEMIHVESEHSAISSAIGVSATGERVFTATASQGLALMHEILHIVSGMRLPIVMAVANRALSAPINIWNDHQDSISARDTGWIQIYAESAQEALDATIQAYKIAENKKVLLPAMVCVDGFTLSHIYEPVLVPQTREVGRYLPKLNLPYTLDPKRPVTMGPVGFPDSFIKFKKQQQDAMIYSKGVIKTAFKDYKKKFGFGEGDGLVEEYYTSDAEIVIAAMGSVCGTIRHTVNELREKGKKVGLLKIRTYRPFPDEEIQKACKNLKNLQVIDKDISLGQQGALYTDIKECLYATDVKVKSFIAGLGGRDITPKDIEAIFENKSKKDVEWLI